MEPALIDGDRLQARRPRGTPRRGAIAVFVHPLIPDFWLVKRVIGLPGERVTIEFGEALIDGQPDIDQWGVGSTFPEGEWQSGPDQVFVLADNRSATIDDGRRFGPLAIDGLLIATRHNRRRR